MRRCVQHWLVIGALLGVLAGCADEPTDRELPELSYTAPVNAYAGQTLIFDASASSDGEGEIAWYGFAFGDGSGAVRSKEPVITHVYDEPGRYTTRVTVVDQRGNKVSELRELTIVDPERVEVLVCLSERPYCPPYFVCDVERSRCIPECEALDEAVCACESDVDCPASLICRDGLCYGSE